MSGKSSKMYEQLSLFDALKKSVASSALSSKDIAKMIRELQRAHTRAVESEMRLRAEEENAERERREREEREKKEAHIREVTCMDLPMDWSNAFDSDERAIGVHTESISDALVLSLTALGRVDIEYISSICGSDYKTVICALKGSIYQNPGTWGECFYKGWETAEEYLSGNLMRKWKEAKEADAQYNGYFGDNIRAIEKVLPPAVPAEDIYVTLGSPWIPTDVIDDFIIFLFGEPPMHYYVDRERLIEMFRTKHDELTGTWEIPFKSRYDHNIAVRETYGTERLEALYILERTLNMQAVAVTDEISCPANRSGKKRVINKADTVAALEKQQKLIKTFQKWVWFDETRENRLEAIFENNFGCVRRRVFDGSFLDFPTMSPSVRLYPYQKDAVARIIFSPNTLLAHEVGAGKTYIMIAAGQELRRMGLSKKNMYVVPNNIVGQWESIFLTMYPGAKLLCVAPKSFTPNKRVKTLERIRDEDFDGIIIAYSCFEQIPLSREYYIEELREKAEIITKLATQKGKGTSRLKKKKEAVEAELAEVLHAVENMYDAVCFDEFGISRLFVDEAHNFKNVPLETKLGRIPGISGAGSKKCRDMMDKVRMMQKQNDGGGVVFATGTPVTNSITDAFIMQSYLQSGELALLDLQSIDSWIGMFAERTTEFEIDVDTSAYRMKTRFSKFHNLPELTSLLSSIADFHQTEESKDIPKTDGYHDALISQTPFLTAYIKDISRRADDVRNGRVGRTDDNMLKITTDGRKAALDMRLVDATAPFSYRYKVERCAENVADIYRRTRKNRSTQIVFCDTSTPKADFNIYTELKERLILLGVPETQIAFIHDAKTEEERSCLFAGVRSGDTAVLLGSTFKLGLGVNIQDRLLALHHMDVPWRPSDMTQREGRILRQGNTNPKVSIYRYITEGSFDAYSWQLLETKQRFITGLLSGSLSERSGADIEDTVLNYAEVKALAIGEPLIKKRVEAANELTRYMTLQRKLVESRIRMEKELLELPGKILDQRSSIRNCEEDLRYYMQWKQENPPALENSQKRDEAKKRKAVREKIGSAIREHVLATGEKTVTRYRGFDVVLPANLTREKPFVWLCRCGKYSVELGDRDIGILTRIDNRLDTLDEHLRDIKKRPRKIRGERSCAQSRIGKGRKLHR